MSSSSGEINKTMKCLSKLTATCKLALSFSRFQLRTTHDCLGKNRRFQLRSPNLLENWNRPSGEKGTVWQWRENRGLLGHPHWKTIRRWKVKPSVTKFLFKKLWYFSILQIVQRKLRHREFIDFTNTCFFIRFWQSKRYLVEIKFCTKVKIKVKR